MPQSPWVSIPKPNPEATRRLFCIPHEGGNNSRQRLCGFENLFDSRAYKNILCHHSPANCPGLIHQELCGTRNVRAVFSLSGVNQIIAANRLESWIREKSKSVSILLNHIFAIDLGLIHADRNWTNSRIRKRRQIVFDTPQLGVT